MVTFRYSKVVSDSCKITIVVFLINNFLRSNIFSQFIFQMTTYLIFSCN